MSNSLLNGVVRQPKSVVRGTRGVRAARFNVQQLQRVCSYEEWAAECTAAYAKLDGRMLHTLCMDTNDLDMQSVRVC